MKTIWKFSIPLTDEAYISGPAPLNVIHVAPDEVHQRLLVWAEVDDTGPSDQLTRALLIVGTGNPIPTNATSHLGSVITPPFVWHVYDGGLCW